ncbi:SRPBCC family protein [Octadecabacter sp.]|nr:SRPBCC family protein [Octadecabacter sp.]
MVVLKQKRAVFTSTIPHLIAAAVALSYAGLISDTSLRTTGLQFVMPALFVIATHFTIVAVWNKLRPSFSSTVFRQSFGTASFIAIALSLGSIFGPNPAYADFGDIADSAFTIVFCGLVIAAVVAVLIGTFRFFSWIIRKLITGNPRPDDDDDTPQTPYFDFGSLIVASTVIVGLSLEGLPNGYSFTSEQTAISTRTVEAPADDVWLAMQTATSPKFPLPTVLDVFPRPVAVLVDEGVSLGANRVVWIEGREGAGDLRLRVIERREDMVEFQVLSDTSPIAGWVGFHTLTYRVVPDGEDTLLSVQLTFERKLALKWFFGPVMWGAAYLAADVLVRDVAARAELVDG